VTYSRLPTTPGATDEVHLDENWVECICGRDVPADYEQCPFCGSEAGA